MVDVVLARGSTKRPESIAVDLVARRNSALGHGVHCSGIQLGNLYFEEMGMPLLGKGHCGQGTGFLRSAPPLPV